MTSPNPYSPPATAVKDAGRVRVLAERPRQVVIATALLWISFPVGLLSYIFAPNTDPLPWPVEAGIWAVLLPVSVVVYVGVWRGWNWARVVNAIFFVLGVVVFPVELDIRPALSIALDVVTGLIGAAVQYLLFTKPGSMWFRYGIGRPASS